MDREDRLRRAPPGARGERVPRLAVRRGRRPGLRRRGGVGHHHLLARLRHRSDPARRRTLPALLRPVLLLPDRLPRLPPERRRVQGHGPGELRRAEVREGPGAAAHRRPGLVRTRHRCPGLPQHTGRLPEPPGGPARRAGAPARRSGPSPPRGHRRLRAGRPGVRGDGPARLAGGPAGLHRPVPGGRRRAQLPGELGGVRAQPLQAHVHPARRGRRRHGPGRAALCAAPAPAVRPRSEPRLPRPALPQRRHRPLAGRSGDRLHRLPRRRGGTPRHGGRGAGRGPYGRVGSTAGWSSARAHWAPGRSWPIRARRRCATG